MASVVSLLIGYPLWAGERGVEKVKRTCKFVPCIADIVPVLDEEVRIARRAREWEEDAHRQLAARNAPRLEGPEKPPKETYEELKARYGPNWGIDDPARKSRAMTRAQALAKLRAEFGDLVDTVPDRPEPDSHVGALAGRVAADLAHRRGETGQRQTEVAE